MNERPFNILIDLLPGDKIRRTRDNGMDGVKKGTVLTFKSYIKHKDLNVDRVDSNVLYAETEEMNAEKAGWIESFEFVERPVKSSYFKPGDKIRRIDTNYLDVHVGDIVTFKAYAKTSTFYLEIEEQGYSMYTDKFELAKDDIKPFNIFTDLKRGDKIKRFEDDFNDLIAGKVVTFLDYSSNDSSNDSLHVKEYDYTMYIKKFELVRQLNKKQEKEMKEELTYNLTALNDNEYLFSITNQPLTNFVFKASTGFKILSQTYVDANVDYGALYLKGDNVHRTSCIIQHNDTSVLSTFLDHMKTAIQEYNESLVKKDIHKEFIEAMKITIKEYLDGTHVFDTTKCALCKVATKYDKDHILNCTICPWVVITGHKCSPTRASKVNERITTLLDWIEQYKAM